MDKHWQKDGQDLKDIKKEVDCHSILGTFWWLGMILFVV
jgi:hypothetical protein